MKSYFLPILGLTLISNLAFGSASVEVLNNCSNLSMSLVSGGCFDATRTKTLISGQETLFSNLKENCTYTLMVDDIFPYGKVQTGKSGKVSYVTLGSSPCQCVSGCT